MAKVFLSHCSSDKEWYVDIVYKRLIKILGSNSVVIDSATFQEGRKTIEEIYYQLDNTDLFVIFISGRALESQWVQDELRRVGQLIVKDKIQQICPIIIDGKISYADIRIPEWMRNEYNIQLIRRQSKAVSIIHQRMIEISFYKHPRLQERAGIFVGRNEYLRQFEERMDDFDKEKPITILASGIEGMGRKTLIYRGLFKCNIVKESYPFSMISLKSDESIEDCILKIYDLGFSEGDKPNNLGRKTIEEKEEILLSMIKELQQLKEIIVIDDKGCLVNYEGKISPWFSDVISSRDLEEKVTLLVVSQFRYYNKQYKENSDRIFEMAVTELDKSERNGLLGRYSEFEELDMKSEKLKYISNLMTGYPEQVFFALTLIKNRGWEFFKEHTDDIVEFNRKKASIMLIDMRNDKEKMEFLALLSSFDYIGIPYIKKIAGEDEKYTNYLGEFYASGICEYLGAMKEYIRVNEAIKDYITRSEFKVSDKYIIRMKQDMEGFLKTIEDNNYDMPEFLFTIKNLLLEQHTIDDKYIIPSVYLKTMNEFYFTGKNKEVVEFADKALENKSYMDSAIKFEIRYLLCLALAKLKHARFKDEVMNIGGADHDFLFGFYYRQIGKFDKALERMNKSLRIRPNYSKAKREKVQAYIGMQDYESALEQSRINYENYRDNPYHIQAYFTCLIKSDVEKSKKEILMSLIQDLEMIGSKVAVEMTLRCKAQYEAFCKSNYDDAINLIEQAIKSNKNINYARLVKFDIAERFDKFEEMENIIEFFKQPDYKTRYYENVICMEAILKSKKGDCVGATEYFMNNIRNYTDEAKDRFIIKLNKYTQKELS